MVGKSGSATKGRCGLESLIGSGVRRKCLLGMVAIFKYRLQPPSSQSTDLLLETPRTFLI